MARSFPLLLLLPCALGFLAPAFTRTSPRTSLPPAQGSVPNALMDDQPGMFEPPERADFIEA